MIRRLFGLAAAVVAAGAVFSSAVLAVQSGGVGGHPANPQPNNPRTNSIFIYQLNPGQQTADGVKIVNNTNKQQTIDVGAVDSVLSSDGAFACAQAADQKKDVGSWISLDSSEVTLAAGASQVVPFTVSVPAGADVGEHDGCVTIQAQSQTAASSAKNGVVLSFRSAIRVVVTVPGKIVKKLSLISLDVKKAKGDKYLVVPAVQNDGNVSLDASVGVSFKSVFATSSGKGGGTYPVLPRSKASWNFELKKPFWGGFYRARAVVSYNNNPTAELGVTDNSSQTKTIYSHYFFALPSIWAGLVELVIILLILVLLFWAARRRLDVREVRQQWRDYTVSENDDIKSVAHQHHTSWKKLAKVNRLKPPYDLHKGKKLKVPPKPRG